MDRGGCEFPDLFGTLSCCICGHESATDCPCEALAALVHLERAHPTGDSALMRRMMGCLLPESDPVPLLSIGTTHEGGFQAPCGDMVAYVTSAQFATMAHYRWHAIYDHLTGGKCRSEMTCGDALMCGDV